MDTYKNISLTWEGDITSMSSWARHARGLLRPLIEGGAHVKLIFQKPSRPEVKLDSFWEEQFTIAPRASPGLLKVNHGPPKNLNRNPVGGPTVLLSHWETINIPVNWVGTINDHFDALWVPSKELLTEATRDVIKIPFGIVPIPLESSLTGNISDIVSLNKQAVVFGAVGQWNQRRNMSDLILAYISEFNAIDNVALVIKTFGNNANDINEKNKIVSLIKDLKRAIGKPNPPEIIILQDIFGQEAFDSILNRINIYVTTSRGDSKDITMQKCAASGKQCVYTDVGVHREFTEFNNDLLYPVPYITEPVIQMPGSYTCDDYWSRPDIRKLSTSLKKAYFDFLTKNLKGDRKDLIKKTKDKWSEKNCLSLLSKAYQEIAPSIDMVSI
jgi:hypothetical protein